MSKLARYVETRTTKAGTAYYFCPPPKLVTEGKIRREALGTDPDKARERAAVLNAEVDRLLSGGKPSTTLQQQIEKGSVADLWDRYQRSQFFSARAETTKVTYRVWMNHALSAQVDGRVFRAMPAADVTPSYADHLVTVMLAKHGPHTTVGAARILHRIFQLGYKWEFCKGNPFTDLELPKLPSRGTVWEPEQIEAFCRKAEELDLSTIGDVLRLSYATAQRPEDILHLRKGDYNPKEKTIRVQQSKTGTVVLIPVEDPMIVGLFSGKPTDWVVPNPTTRKPYSKSSFYPKFNMIRDRAGLPENLQLRDMRRTVATELGDREATEDEIMSITGHKSRAVVSVYVKKTLKQARNAMAKRWRADLNSG